ncbi:TOBE domain-containing protein [Leeuwenhoekiella aequorea]|uniref:Molybdopterin-binding protein n=1 Tax=Leeuwenhoekiella aequorea TaxID=283736 RepID=A0A4Q0P7H1_9FLAO|nr:TOBE domain-containing protein [Leeuwenhoekiella aequorea]RXG22567.1 molybdopterin-binding protein [Leeuwenhoekiella aequorea]
MNNFEGFIKTVHVNGNLSIVDIDVTSDILMKAIVIDTPETASYLKSNAKVSILFKETEVIIGLGDQSGISLQNKIPAIITHLEIGNLLCKLDLKSDAGIFTAIISAAAAVALDLKVEDEVIAMIKLNEVMLRSL